MKLTKQALLTASVVFGATMFALGARETDRLSGGIVELDDSNAAVMNKNYLIEYGTDVVFNVEKSATLQGNLFGALVLEGSGLVATYAPLDNTMLTITGGGTLEYKGFKDISYYNGKPYSLTSTDSEIAITNTLPTSLIGKDTLSGKTSAETSAYSGSLTVSGGTNLKVSGYLTQYVSMYYSYNGASSVWAGVQSYTLEDTSKISFVSSTKNLLNVFNDENNVARTNSLNFLRNVKASAESTIELGDDTIYRKSDGTKVYSTMRLVVDASAGTTSTIGHLAGTGRIYFTGSGAVNHSTVYFTSKAQFATGIVPTAGTSGGAYTGDDSGPKTFDTGSWLDYIHGITDNYETTGEKIGGALADVFLSSGVYHIGTDESGNVVNNIFASATALQFRFWRIGDGDVAGGIEQGIAGEESVLYPSLGQVYVPNSLDLLAEIYIHGTQIINNFQSMNGAHSDRLGMDASVYEGNLVKGFTELYEGYSYWGDKVKIESDSVLVLNQDKYRDGIYQGVFCGNDTTKDGVIIKAGEGNFVNIFDGEIAYGSDIPVERLYVLEGKWITSIDAIASTKVTIGEKGTFVIVENRDKFFYGSIKSSQDSELHIVRNSSIENGSEEDGISGTVVTSNWLSPANGVVEIVNAQDEFYGTVVVGRGMTLALGFDRSENYSNAFVNAKKIVLAGEADVSGGPVNTSKIVIGSTGASYNPSYVQLLSLYYSEEDSDGNIVYTPGVGKYGKVSVTNYATLAWNIKSSEQADFTGVDIAAAGALVKLNRGSLVMESPVSYLGATSVLNGSLSLKSANTLNRSAGLVLAGNAGVFNDSRSDQHFDALVGGESTALSMGGGALTIGVLSSDFVGNVSPVANYFLATYNGDEKYFASGGLDLQIGAGISDEKRAELFGELGQGRPNFDGHEITLEDTVNYIKDPANLSDTLARAHAVVDSATWDIIKTHSAFDTTESMFDYFNNVFDVDTIRNFKDSSPIGWTNRQLEILLEFATELSADSEVLFEKEGRNYNLTMAGYSVLKENYALKYLAEVILGNSTLTDLSFYNFIREFAPDYEFCFTEANVAALQTKYGITAQNKEAFAKAIGVVVNSADYGPSFAGTISGSGTSLTKIGKETLTLTGRNNYSGNTYVKEGELRVNHDSISSDVVRVDEGALLTVVSEDVSGLGESVEFNPQLLAGAGTLLKDGAGTLELNALAEKCGDVDDFTGAIIVGKDTLQINISTRKELKSDLFVNENAKIVFNFNESDNETVSRELTLSGGLSGNGEIEFSGAGTVVFSDGDTVLNDENSNVKFSSAGDTAVSLVFMLDGFAGDPADNNRNSEIRATADFSVAAGTSLKFNLARYYGNSQTGTDLVYNCESTINENASALTGELIVSGTALDDFGGTLRLRQEANLEKITVEDRGSLEIASDVTATKIFVGTETCPAKLSVDSGGTLTADKITVVSGSEFESSGTITAKEIVLNSAATLTGSLTVSSALTLNADAALVGTLDLSGAEVSVADDKTLKILKTAVLDAYTDITLGENANLIVSGSGETSVLENLSGAGTSTLTIDGGELDYSDNRFDGDIALVNGATLNVGTEISEINAVSGDGTVYVDCAAGQPRADLSVSVNTDVEFSGTIEFETDPDIVVDGNAVWTIAGANFVNVDHIVVKDGAGVGIGAGAAGAISGAGILLGDNAVLALSGDYAGTSMEQDFETDPSLSKITLRMNSAGSISADVSTLEGVFNLSGKLPGEITLSNFNGNLRIQNEPDSEISLETYGTSGALVLDGEFEYGKSIGGNGNLVIAEDANIALNASSHGFTGTLTVETGATLAVDNATLAAGTLTVKNSATLAGGVTLAPTAAVVFEAGSFYSATLDDGDKIKAGTISGTVGVEIMSEDVPHGTSFQLFEALENGGLDNLDITVSIADSQQKVMLDRDSDPNKITAYVVQENLANAAGAHYHNGLESMLGALSKIIQPNEFGEVSNSVGHKLNTLSGSALSDAVEKLSPLSYASMVSMPASTFAANQRTISQRLEQRLYDNTSPHAVWDYASDWEFFAQAQSTSSNAGTGSDSAVYDANTFGVLAGADIKLSHSETLGMAVSYNHGNADIHRGGGKITGEQIALTGFAGLMAMDTIAFNLGAEIGFSSFDIERQNGFGLCKGDANGVHGGVFAEALTAIPLHEFLDGERIDLIPHAGFALGYYRVGSNKESGADGALDVDGFSALSLQAKVGAELAAVFTLCEYKTRATLDFSLIHEFLDDEVEIDAKISGRNFSTDARAFSKTSFSVAPGISLDLSAKTSVYLNYEFRAGTESMSTHSVNLGFRHRF